MQWEDQSHSFILGKCFEGKSSEIILSILGEKKWDSNPEWSLYPGPLYPASPAVPDVNGTLGVRHPERKGAGFAVPARAHCHSLPESDFFAIQHLALDTFYSCLAS